ncbi:hypothetical protein BC826DRAFT_738606 [Russula brevipes]|nr:hypothetical protein BC826DRAFT_738606 [Russula brevipes]
MVALSRCNIVRHAGMPVRLPFFIWQLGGDLTEGHGRSGRENQSQSYPLKRRTNQREKRHGMDGLAKTKTLVGSESPGMDQQHPISSARAGQHCFTVSSSNLSHSPCGARTNANVFANPTCFSLFLTYINVTARAPIINLIVIASTTSVTVENDCSIMYSSISQWRGFGFRGFRGAQSERLPF